MVAATPILILLLAGMAVLSRIAFMLITAKFGYRLEIDRWRFTFGPAEPPAS
jgi:hypothetical protein